MAIEIREEQSGDIPAIRDVNRRAFGQDQESNIVDALRTSKSVLLSLVASLNGQVVGHMVLLLNEAKTQGMSGMAEYRHEFSTVS